MYVKTRTYLLFNPGLNNPGKNINKIKKLQLTKKKLNII